MNDLNFKVALAPVVVSDGTAQKTVAIDTLGYESVTFVVMTGTLADVDATWSATLKDGATSTQASHTQVASDFIIGSEALAGLTFADDGVCKKIGYKGGKRYVSLELTNVVANTGAAPLAILAVLGDPKVRPTANPPV
jgi:hypothetical protein